ncbi:hypothetical protein M4A92_18220, partial [Caldibacillus thermoamylovorans]|uniref:hypothetical protein n=1 Tax=Caldibacillus thermoamylovorans TaxID=35841 RepID=UPI00203CBEF2
TYRPPSSFYLVCQVLSLTSQIETTTLVSHQMKVVSTQKCEYPKLCEFDGMVIHPMRQVNQILFLEVKNTDNNPSYAINAYQKN